MSHTINSTIPLREVIYMYSEAAKKTDAEFLRLWRMCFRGFVQIGLNAFFPVKTVDLPVNDNNTVTLPNDCLQWVRIGERTMDGMITYKSDNSLYSGSGVEGVASLQNSQFWFNGFNRIGRSYGDRWVTFKVMDKHIEFQNDFDQSRITLEYVCAPEKDIDFEIPIQFQEAFLDFLSWQDVKHLPTTSHFNRGDKADKAAAFRASVKLARKMYKPFRIEEYL